MTANQLADYLKVLRDAKVMACNFKCKFGSFAVTFEPDAAHPVPKVTEPGGWKVPVTDKPFEGPSDLDKSFEDEVP